MNPLWKLLESDLQTCKDPMTMHKNMAITRSAFIEQYNHYCRNNFKHMHVEDLSPDIYIPVFKKFGIKAVQAKHKWKGNWVETTFLYGLGFNHMYKGIIKRLSARFLKEYNEKAEAEGRPKIDADDEYDQEDDENDEGGGGGGAVNSVTGCSGPIIGKIDWNATETKPSFMQDEDEDDPTEWDRMVTRLNEGKAKAARRGIRKGPSASTPLEASDVARMQDAVLTCYARRPGDDARRRRASASAATTRADPDATDSDDSSGGDSDA